jgi:hypothetical protein
MPKGLIWVIVIIVLNAVVAALAKKAQANAQAAKQGISPPAPPPAPPMQQQGATAGRAAARTVRGGAREGAREGARKGSRAGTNSGSSSGSSAAPRPPKPPKGRSYVVDAVEDSSDAMQSRKRLAEQVAKVKAAEAKVAQASGIKADRSAMAQHIAPKIMPVGAIELRKALSNPADIRKALILGEVLGRPRGAQAF